MATAINEQLKALADLQTIDSEIYRLKKELAVFPDRKKKAEEEFEKKKAGMKAAESELKAQQLRQKDKEGELAGKEEKIKKLQTQLYQLKTNKEYSAMDLEIKGLKADNSLLEEEILKAIDAVDAAKAGVAKEKEALAAEEKRSKATIDEIEKQAADIQSKLDAESAKRKEYLSAVDPKLLSQYERILDKREGLAIVPVWKNACGGCHVGLPPQTVNEVQMKDKLVTCEECARILYWPG